MHQRNMRIYHGWSVSPRPAAVALGGFDGLHVGHCGVIAQARKDGLLPSVFTFQTDLFQEGKKVPRILSQRRKMELLDQMGVRQCWVAPFEEIRHMEAEEFLSRILEDVCGAKLIACGYNFRFGRGGKGTSGLLREFCEFRGIEARILPPVQAEGETVSSTRIRELVAEGDMKRAAALLGRPFCLDTPVLHGRQLGRTLGFPTVNQPVPRNFVLPRFGVYASVVRIDGIPYYGVTNVGVKPTVGADAPLSETWLPGYRGRELYGEILVTELIGFVRPEQKFGSVEELREQIARDAISVQKMIYKP